MLKIWMLIERVKSAVVNDEQGISAVEYGVLGAIVIVAVAAAAGTITGGITTAFNDISSALNGTT